jgi:hypothetical protein
MDSVITNVTIVTVMALTVGFFILGLWLAQRYFTPDADAPPAIGRITLGDYVMKTNSTEIHFTTDGECSDCVVDFQVIFTYTDKQTKSVKRTAVPDTKVGEFDWTRYDTTEEVYPVSMDVTAYISNVLDKRGPVTKRTYSIIRS